MDKYKVGNYYIKDASLSGTLPSVTKEKSTGKMDQEEVVFKSQQIEGKETYTFVGTSEAIDRDGDIVVQSGIKTDDFSKNPVVLWSHENRSLPVGKVTSVRKNLTTKETYFDIQFSSTDFGKTIETLVSEGILKATSIGFRVKDWDYSEEAGAWLLKEIDIHEISICTVPANQTALIVEDEKSAKSLEKSLDLDNEGEEEVLEDAEHIKGFRITKSAVELVGSKGDRVIETIPLDSATAETLIAALRAQGVEVEDTSDEDPEPVQENPAEEAAVEATTPTAEDGETLQLLRAILEVLTPVAPEQPEAKVEVPEETGDKPKDEEEAPKAEPTVEDPQPAEPQPAPLHSVADLNNDDELEIVITQEDI